MKKLYEKPQILLEQYVSDSNISSGAVVGCYICRTGSAPQLGNPEYDFLTAPYTVNDEDGKWVIPSGSQINWICDMDFPDDTSVTCTLESAY